MLLKSLLFVLLVVNPSLGWSVHTADGTYQWRGLMEPNQKWKRLLSPLLGAWAGMSCAYQPLLNLNDLVVFLFSIHFGQILPLVSIVQFCLGLLFLFAIYSWEFWSIKSTVATVVLNRTTCQVWCSQLFPSSFMDCVFGCFDHCSVYSGSGL